MEVRHSSMHLNARQGRLQRVHSIQEGLLPGCGVAQGPDLPIRSRSLSGIIKTLACARKVNATRYPPRCVHATPPPEYLVTLRKPQRGHHCPRYLGIYLPHGESCLRSPCLLLFSPSVDQFDGHRIHVVVFRFCCCSSSQ